MKFLKLFIVALFALSMNLFSQDPDFYIFLCFGQSNMEGFPTKFTEEDKLINNRLKIFQAVDCPAFEKTKENWYTATPPLCRCNTGVSPADYFGRTMVANLPEKIKIGIINVSVAGCKIELFEKDSYQTYASTAAPWMVNIIKEYNGNPYGRLVELAKLAQKDGVIKGILLHQGESNPNDSLWPMKVKGIYDNLIKDLNLNAGSVPFLAGEMVNADQGGACAAMNNIIANLPQSVPNSYVISSKGCECRPDKIHFATEGYKKLGSRYAIKMLSLLGYNIAETE